MFDIYKETQPLAFKILMRQLETNKVSHAYIFESKNSEIQFNFAKDFAKMLFCEKRITNKKDCKECNICNMINNNNFIELKIIEPDGLFIKKEQLLELQSEFNKKAIMSDKKIYIIKNCEKLNQHAANCLLKFLEEPEENIFALLLTNNIYQVLETIVSRCQIIKLNNLNYQNCNEDNSSDFKVLNLNFYNNELTENKLSLDIVSKYNIKILDFLLYLEKNKIETIADINNLWSSIFNTKELLIYGYDIMVLVYKDVLNIIISNELEIFNDYYDYIFNIAKFNDKHSVVKKINLINNLKEKINSNINNALLMDKFIIGCWEE